MKKLFVVSLMFLGLAIAMPVSAANSLAVTTAAHLNGSVYGLAVTSDRSSNDVYVSSTHPNNESVYRFSFRIFPGTFTSYTTPNTFDDYLIGFVETTTGSECGASCKPWSIPIYLRRQNVYWTIQANTRNDTNLFPTWQNAVKICGDPSTTIPCSSYTNGLLFEFEYHAASAPGANDGFMTVKRNGVLSQNFTGLNNDQRLVKSIRWGAIFQGDANNRPGIIGNGTYYFDDFASYRTAAP
jgi:hypothetical protein